MGKNGYDFYLGTCLLPVAPPKLTVKINNANETVTLMDGGEINILKEARLTDIEFECRIPQMQYPFAVYKAGFQDAGYFLDYFESLKTGKKPFQFIVYRSRPTGKVLFDMDIKVSMEDYKITEDAKEGFDLLVKIKLKQWREYGTKTVDITAAGSGAKATTKAQRDASTSPAPSSPQKYTVVRGDSLWSIAKRYYGNGSKHTIIYDANRDVIGGNPNRIYPGQVLLLPAAQGRGKWSGG